MNFIHEQDVARLQIGQQSGQIARTLEHGAGGLPQVDLQLIGNDVRQRGLAEPRWTEDQNVVQCLAALPRRLDENRHLILYVRLSDIVGEAFRAHGAIDHLIVAAAGACNDPILFDTHGLLQALTADLRARRMISVVESPGSSADFNKRVTSGGL